MSLCYSEDFRILLRSIAPASNLASVLFYPSNSQYAPFIKTDVFNHIGLKDDKPTAIPARSLAGCENSFDAEKYRTNVKVGKLFKALVDIDALREAFPSLVAETDRELERVATAFSKYVNAKNLTFELHTGEALRDAYHKDNYAYGSGSLHCSCMRYAECQDYLDIYVFNPDVCSLLVASNSDNEVMGRALVWTTAKGQYLDRIYSASTDEISEYAVAELMKSYAVKCGIKTERGRIPDVQLSEWHFDSYPYLDTLTHLDMSSGTLSQSSGDRQLQDTDGGYTDANSVWSEYECEYIDEDEAIWIDNRNTYVHSESAFYCVECESHFVESDVTREDRNYYCDECHSENFTTCDASGDTIRVEDSFECFCGCGTYSSDVAMIAPDGETYFEDCEDLPEDADVVDCDACGRSAIDGVRVGHLFECPDCYKTRRSREPNFFTFHERVECDACGGRAGLCHCAISPFHCAACTGNRPRHFACTCAVVVMETAPPSFADVQFDGDTGRIAVSGINFVLNSGLNFGHLYSIDVDGSILRNFADASEITDYFAEAHRNPAAFLSAYGLN